MSAYEQIARGVLRFRRHVFPQRRAVYQSLAHHPTGQLVQYDSATGEFLLWPPG